MRKRILGNVEDFLVLGFQHIEIKIENNGFSIIPTKKTKCVKRDK